MNLPLERDFELIDQTFSGDCQAKEALLQKYQGYLYVERSIERCGNGDKKAKDELWEAVQIKDILDRCLNRDEKAWEEFVSHFQKLILSAVWKIYQDQSQEFIEDIVGEFYLEKLISHNFKGLREYAWTIKFTTWLYQRARWFALDEKKKIARRLRVMNDYEQESKEKQTLIDIEEDVGKEERLFDLLHKAMSKLEPLQRRILELHYEGKKSYKEIALGLNIPVGTVGSHLTRAREQLKKIMGRGGEILGQRRYR